MLNMQTFITKLKNSLINSQDISSKGFLTFLCIDFSFLVNGIILTFIGMYPTFSELSQNTFRIYLGGFLIAIWFVFIPNISKSAKDKAILRLAYSLLALLSVIIIVQHWLNYSLITTFQLKDIGIIIISIPTIAYLLYCFINLVKLMFWIIQKILHRILPAPPNENQVENKERSRGLVYTLEAVTSLFVAISSFIGAFWGIVATIKVIFK